MTQLTKKEQKEIAKWKSEAALVITAEEFAAEFNRTVDTPIGKAPHMRWIEGSGMLKAFGYYAFLNPKTLKKTFVTA